MAEEYISEETPQQKAFVNVRNLLLGCFCAYNQRHHQTLSIYTSRRSHLGTGDSDPGWSVDKAEGPAGVAVHLGGAGLLHWPY